MRDKHQSTDTSELTEDQKIQLLVQGQGAPGGVSPLDYDPAEPSDQEHLELLEDMHGYRCILHRLSEHAVEANYRALLPANNLPGAELRSAWSAGFFHGIKTAMGVREALIAEITNDEDFKLDTNPTRYDQPPRAGQKAVATQKPTLGTRTRKKPRRKSA